jgi:hypothetical protein
VPLTILWRPERGRLMANYLLTYVGLTHQDSEETEEAGKAEMEAWMAWFGGLGESVVDTGNPTGLSAAMSPDGTVGSASAGVTGYSVVSADSLAAAVEITRGCPHLAAGGRVEVYEIMDVM